MGNGDLSGTRRGLLWAKVGAVVSSSLYATMLTTKVGRRVEREHTWFVVMVGVLITLGWVSTEDDAAAKKSFGYFVLTGLPIIVRAIYLYSQFTSEIVNRELKRGNQA